MSALHMVLYIIHMLAMVAIVIAPAISGGKPSLLQVWGARIQLLIGLALVGVMEGMGDADLNHMKIGVKLLISIAVVALCEISWAKAKRGEVKLPPLPWIAAGLAVVNAVIAFVW
ncbi:hypothetical protein [Janibacter sp. GXQ6167]|uniref:hypothetical protein n=1 Tax=Janibacter sp. GXQ6167 TaxID=3240791 RepID=UPI0035245482